MHEANAKQHTDIYIIYIFYVYIFFSNILRPNFCLHKLLEEVYLTAHSANLPPCLPDGLGPYGPLVGYGWGGVSMHRLIRAHFGSPTFGIAVRVLLCRRISRAWARSCAWFACRLSLLSGLAACSGSLPSDLSAFVALRPGVLLCGAISTFSVLVDLAPAPAHTIWPLLALGLASSGLWFCWPWLAFHAVWSLASFGSASHALLAHHL